MNKIDKFYEVKNYLRCPKCGKKIRFHAGGLVCKKEHRFDISSKGYVNLLQVNKPLKGYSQEFFESRNRFMNAGYYSHVAKAVEEQVRKHLDARFAVSAGKDGEKDGEKDYVIVDAGCGEGYYSRILSGIEGAQILAFDLSAEAIKTAVKSCEPVKWMVADITDIPVKDGVTDCILDVFTPANYKEFERILADDGIVIKVIPGQDTWGNCVIRQRSFCAVKNIPMKKFWIIF